MAWPKLQWCSSTMELIPCLSFSLERSDYTLTWTSDYYGTSQVTCYNGTSSWVETSSSCSLKLFQSVILGGSSYWEFSAHLYTNHCSLQFKSACTSNSRGSTVVSSSSQRAQAIWGIYCSRQFKSVCTSNLRGSTVVSSSSRCVIQGDLL